MKHSGNTILITGGGSGIGRGLAEEFHKLGNQVIIAGRRKQALDETTAANPGMKSLTLDIEDPAAIRAFAARAVAEFPALNVLINNAGIMRAENLLAQQADLADAEAIVSTNLLGPIRLTAALLPHLQKQAHAAHRQRLFRIGLCPAGADAHLLRHQGGDSLLHAIAPPSTARNAGRGDRTDPALCGHSPDEWRRRSARHAARRPSSPK